MNISLHKDEDEMCLEGYNCIDKHLTELVEIEINSEMVLVCKKCYNLRVTAGVLNLPKLE